MLSSESAPELKMSLWSEVGEGKEGCSHKYSPSRAGEGLGLSSPEGCARCSIICNKL